MSTSAVASLLEQALAAFEAASFAAGGIREHLFELGGLPVRVLVAGPALEPRLLASLAHLAVPTPRAGSGHVGPGLTIHAWDSASTGTRFPSVPWGGSIPGSPRAVPFFEAGGVRVLVNPNSGVLSILDGASNRAVYWVEAAEKVPSHECAAPFRMILQWWMADHDRLLAHSAAVGTAQRGLLIAGGAGAGKSTTAWLCLRHGLELAGDDYVILAQQPPDRVFSLYSSLKLAPEHRARPRDEAAGAAGEKVVTYLMPDYERLLARSLALEAILVPRFTGRRGTSIGRASSGDAMRALAPTTLSHQAGTRAEAFRVLADLVRRIPCHALELGGDLEAVPGVIDRFLRTV